MLLSQRRIDNLTKPRTLKLFTDYPPVPVSSFMGKHVAIFGVTGSGKSVTGATFAEELDEQGFVLAMIDPEGDYTSLAEYRPDRFAVYGRKFKEDSAGITSASIRKAVSRILDQRKSVILYLRQYGAERRVEITKEFLQLLFQRVNYEEPRIALAVYLDEIHQFAPQNKAIDVELLNLIGDYARLGRKRGIMLVGLSQRPSDVNKNVVTQCDIKFLHAVRYPNDIDAYNLMLNFRGDSLIHNRRMVQASVLALEPGQCWYTFPSFGSDDDGNRRVRVRMRHSRHTSATPGVEVLRG